MVQLSFLGMMEGRCWLFQKRSPREIVSFVLQLAAQKLRLSALCELTKLSRAEQRFMTDEKAYLQVSSFDLFCIFLLGTFAD